MTRKQLDSRIVDEIDRNLRQAFDQTVNEPVPDRFTELLSQLKAAESSSGSKSQGADDA